MFLTKVIKKAASLAPPSKSEYKISDEILPVSASFSIFDHTKPLSNEKIFQRPPDKMLAAIITSILPGDQTPKRRKVFSRNSQYGFHHKTR
jgi:hypothetical protein